MKRIVVISTIVLASVLTLVVLGISVLLYSAPGRALLIAQAEPAIGTALGGDANIGTIKGALPGHIIIEDIALSENGEIWARIERIDLSWRPLALIKGKVDINALIIDDGTLLREPPKKPDDPDKEQEPFSIKLPHSLPNVTVRELQINNFHSALHGVDARLDGDGAIAMAHRAISAKLNLKSASETDTIDLAIDIAPGADRIYIDTTIVAASDGLFAALADFGGPVFIEINADSPSHEAEISVNALLGHYGKLDAKLLTNLENLVSINADGVFTSGPQLADTPELSAPIKFNFYLHDEKDGGRLTINRLLTSAGELAGDIVWEGKRKNSNRLTADLRATLDDSYRPELQPYIGRDITMVTTLQRRPGDYGLELRLRGSDIDTKITDGSTDLKSKISGKLIATLAAGDGFPSQPTDLSTNFAIDLDDAASLRGLNATIGDQLTVLGDADYSFADNGLRFEGDVDVAPEFVTSLSPTIVPQGRLIATIDAQGTAERFTIDANAQTPAIIIGENSTPALNATIALAGLPMLPTGEINAAPINGTGSFAATLRSSTSGRIAVPSITYTGPGFNLSGSGAFNPKTQNGDIDLVYDGNANAQPWPGLIVAGDLMAKGQFAREGTQTDLTIQSNVLRIADTAIQNLSVAAKGDPSAIDITLSSNSVSNADGTRITNIGATATVNAQDDIVVQLTRLDASLLDTAMQLSEPGTLTLADNIAIENLRLDWGAHGRIAIDGAFSATQWRGVLNLDNINLPQTDSSLSANISLDTVNPTPATGNIKLSSLLSQEAATLSADLAWNGKALLVTSLPDTDPLEMRLALPAQLTTSPAISVATDGAISGFVRFDGAVDSLSAFLPTDLQTLEGFLALDLRVAGTTASPEFSGVAELTDAAYTELRSGLSLDGLHTRAEANYTQTGSMISFSGGGYGGGQSGEDTIIINGAMTLGDTSRADIAIELKNAEFAAYPISTLRADGKVEISGPLGEITTKGAIDIQELSAEIITPESTGLVPIEVVNLDTIQDGDDMFADTPQATSFDLDLTVSADDRIFVRGRGLESEWRADIRAVTERSEIVVLGNMRLRRGTLDFAGQRFEVTTGEIAFDRLTKNNPLLDIHAELETDDDVTAVIEISGRANTPSITLTSTPTLPQEDIIGLMLFGKPASDLTAFESLQTAQALASLGGIGPFGAAGGLSGSLRQATGLDLLNFDVDPENGGGSLTVGKYVADGLFVSATQDAQGTGGAVIIEYDITDNISVETEIRQDGDQTVSANWKKDF